MAGPGDALDREILNEIQWRFPLEVRPYHAIAARFGIAPGEAMSRLSRLRADGVLRQTSAIFDTRRLGYSSSLVAARVDPGRIEEAAREINRHPGVSHNYERGHEFNLWFTIAVPPGADLEAEVGHLGSAPGVEAVRMLPTLRLFKIGVKLDMVGAGGPARPTEGARGPERPPFEAAEEDREFIRQLQKDLPVRERPFLPAARALGTTEEDVLERLRRYQEAGVMRRFAAILRHRDAGFAANGMIVWKVPPGEVARAGELLGAFPQVSHCYERPTYPDWPYSLFSMVHCRTRGEARALADEIASQVGGYERDILFSLREFKKTRVEYFAERAAAPPPRAPA